jgi:2-oxoglutarate dehydrogenase E1 component
MPLLVHGDAAFAGQGVVAETLNFSQLPGYRTGGTLHIVINNQIGFTTLPSDARSTRYCSDVAKMIEAPIFHVNGDDPEAVCMVARLALEFRVKFQRDVVIDMYCFRRHGHNEADEPAFTQPTLYRTIAAHPLVSSLYTGKLINEGSHTVAECDAIKAEYMSALEANLEKAKQREAEKTAKRKAKAAAAAANLQARFAGSTAVFQPAYSHAAVPTGVSSELIAKAIRGLTTLPAGFKVNPKIKRLLDSRSQALKDGGPVDWSLGEALAHATLLLEGVPVRLSGQDCERGTFSHRHAVLHDYETRERFTPLNHLDEGRQARFCVYNSLLSEAAVLGFDYGYSLDYPQMLIMWEAQFGDFANGAQVVIDQFIVSGESKWQRTSGIVLLLPHGYEGQGPEHSSARLERFLQLCAENNIQVANITTPANLFHVLRRQMKRDFLKPLVIMSPKSLLRHPGAISRLDEFTSGSFQEILDDPQGPKQAARLLLCSGKVYYDLADYREKHGITDTASFGSSSSTRCTRSACPNWPVSTPAAGWSGSRRNRRIWAPGLTSLPRLRRSLDERRPTPAATPPLRPPSARLPSTASNLRTCSRPLSRSDSTPTHPPCFSPWPPLTSKSRRWANRSAPASSPNGTWPTAQRSKKTSRSSNSRPTRSLRKAPPRWPVASA